MESEHERKEMPTEARIRSMFSKIREDNNNKIVELKKAIVEDHELRPNPGQEMAQIAREDAMNALFQVVAINHARLAKRRWSAVTIVSLNFYGVQFQKYPELICPMLRSMILIIWIRGTC